jgi:esterase/lipase
MEAARQKDEKDNASCRGADEETLDTEGELFMDEFEEINGPLLVIHSSEDHIFPEDYVTDIYRRLECDKDIKIYKAPHLVTIEHVPEILPDIAGWLREKSST